MAKHWLGTSCDGFLNVPGTLVSLVSPAGIGHVLSDSLLVCSVPLVGGGFEPDLKLDKSSWASLKPCLIHLRGPGFYKTCGTWVVSSGFEDSSRSIELQVLFKSTSSDVPQAAACIPVPLGRFRVFVSVYSTTHCARSSQGHVLNELPIIFVSWCFSGTALQAGMATR